MTFMFRRVKFIESNYLYARVECVECAKAVVEEWFVVVAYTFMAYLHSLQLLFLLDIKPRDYIKKYIFCSKIVKYQKKSLTINQLIRT